MALELAVAFVRVKVDKAHLRSEIAMARKEIIRGLSGIKVKVDVDAAAFERSARSAGAAAGRAAKSEFQRGFGGIAVPPGSGMSGGAGFAGFGGQRRLGTRGLSTTPQFQGQPGAAGFLPGPVTQVGAGQFLIGGPRRGPIPGQRRIGQTFFTGSGGPTFGGGGVPHGTGRVNPRTGAPPGPFGPFAAGGGGGGFFGGGGRGGFGGGFMGMGGGRGFGGMRGAGPFGRFAAGAGFAVSPMMTGVSMFGGTAAAGGFAAGLGGVASVREFADFEKAIRRVEFVQQNAGASPEAIEKLRQQALDLGRTTVFSAKEAAGAMVTLSQKGFDALQVYQQMPAVLDLAAAGQISIAESADIASSALKVFGMEAKDTKKVADVLTTAFLNSSAEVKDIGVALRFVGPAAKIAGKDLEEAVAGIMMLRNAGMTPSMAGTGLNRFLTFLTVPNKRSKLEAAGINPLNAQGGLRGLPDILGQAGAALSGMTDSDRLAFQHEVFGFRGGPAFGALLQQGRGQAESNLSKLYEANGIAAEGAAHELENLSAKITLFVDALKDLGIAFGENEAGPVSGALGLGAKGLSLLSGGVRLVGNTERTLGGGPGVDSPLGRMRRGLSEDGSVPQGSEFLRTLVGFPSRDELSREESRGRVLDDRLRRIKQARAQREAAAEKASPGIQGFSTLFGGAASTISGARGLFGGARSALSGLESSPVLQQLDAARRHRETMGTIQRLSPLLGPLGGLGASLMTAPFASKRSRPRMPSPEDQQRLFGALPGMAEAATGFLTSPAGKAASGIAGAVTGSPLLGSLSGIAGALTGQVEKESRRQSFRSRTVGLEGLHSSIQQQVLNRQEQEKKQIQSKIEGHTKKTKENTSSIVNLLQNPPGAAFS